MRTIDAFAMGDANRGREEMVFDWIKAAEIIKERKSQMAAAGLRSDWECTGGRILFEGRPVPEQDTYTYLASTWAVPELIVDGELIECYLMESETPGWNSGTYWPNEALEILGIE